MRIALISDIHGQNIALQAVLSDITKQNIDTTICLGDVASLGPQPREVLKTLRRLKIPTVMGNHDAVLLGIGGLTENNIAPFLAESIKWGTQQLTEDDKAYMHTFLPTYTVQYNGRSYALCFHATPTSRIDQLLATTPEEVIEKMLAPYQEQLFIGGHTHIQMVRKHGEKTIVNPGSVGNVFRKARTDGAAPTILPWAEYAILQIEHGNVSVELKKIGIDLELSLEILRQSSLPIKEYLIQAYSTQAEQWLASF